MDECRNKKRKGRQWEARQQRDAEAERRATESLADLRAPLGAVG